MLRDYQQRASDAALEAFYDPKIRRAVITAATASGKSHIIADIAYRVRQATGKPVLCLAPTKELVQQNHSKYTAAHGDAGIFCNGLGRKEISSHVIFGSIKSVKNALNKFPSVSLLISDECEGVTDTYRAIANHFDCFELGLTATPFKTGKGYIYRRDHRGGVLDDTLALTPYYDQEIIRIDGQELENKGYLAPLKTVAAGARYNIDYKGATQAKLDQSYIGQGRKTSQIIQEVVQRSQHKKAVLIFAQTIEHAKEILVSLPPEQSAIVLGKSDDNERDEILQAFASGKLKYIVNVQVLTVGYDAPYVDHIAVLRPTASPGLLLQILGRGRRTFPGKEYCLISDYAQNIERHFRNENDLHNITVNVKGQSDLPTIEIECEKCGEKHVVVSRWKHPVPQDGYGYIIDDEGNRLPKGAELNIRYSHTHEDRAKELAAGARLLNVKPKNNDPHAQWALSHWSRTCSACKTRWEFTRCVSCNHHNDPTATHCEECGYELIDPNSKLYLPPTAVTEIIEDYQVTGKWRMKKDNKYIDAGVWLNIKTTAGWRKMLLFWYGKDKETPNPLYWDYKGKPKYTVSYYRTHNGHLNIVGWNYEV